MLCYAYVKKLKSPTFHAHACLRVSFRKFLINFLLNVLLNVLLSFLLNVHLNFLLLLLLAGTTTTGTTTTTTPSPVTDREEGLQRYVKFGRVCHQKGPQLKGEIISCWWTHNRKGPSLHNS